MAGKTTLVRIYTVPDPSGVAYLEFDYPTILPDQEDYVAKWMLKMNIMSQDAVRQHICGSINVPDSLKDTWMCRYGTTPMDTVQKAIHLAVENKPEGAPYALAFIGPKTMLWPENTLDVVKKWRDNFTPLAKEINSFRNVLCLATREMSARSNQLLALAQDSECSMETLMDMTSMYGQFCRNVTGISYMGAHLTRVLNIDKTLRQSSSILWQSGYVNVEPMKNFSKDLNHAIDIHKALMQTTDESRTSSDNCTDEENSSAESDDSSNDKTLGASIIMSILAGLAAENIAKRRCPDQRK